eukprot:1189093-Prorocentrum_minimum.AAC.2
MYLRVTSQAPLSVSLFLSYRVLTVGAPPHLQEAFKINAFEPCTGNIPRALMRVALTMGLPKLIVGE